MSAVPPTQTQQQKQSQRPLRILLVNDDGPPASHSPHILGLYQALVARGHKVSVVIPCSQRSWGAMAFSISGEAGVWWYYPREGDHMDKTIGERWETRPRPIKVGEIGEWVLVDGVSSAQRQYIFPPAQASLRRPRHSSQAQPFCQRITSVSRQTLHRPK